MPDSPAELPAFSIESRILLVRGQKVMLDSDLAELYGVPTKAFNQAVKRNQARFPKDFMFQLTLEEGRQLESLRSQSVTLKRGQHRKYAPYVFTEQGIAMLSSVLTSERAILVNIAIIRTFVRLRQILATHEELARRLDALEWRQNEQGQKIQAVFETLQHLIEAPAEEPAKRRIGFPASHAAHTPTSESEGSGGEDQT
jgi:phage regulator Rha-like protein